MELASLLERTLFLSINRCRIRIIVLLLIFGVSVMGGNAESILLNGNFKFSVAGSLPDKWTMSDNAFWKAQNSDLVTVNRGEEGNFLTVTNNNSKKGISVSSPLVMLDGEKKIQLKVRYRLANLKKGLKSWQTASIRLNFFDKQGKRVKRYDKIDIKEDCEWKTTEKIINVPSQTVNFSVAVVMDVSCGTLDVAEITVTDVSPGKNSPLKSYKKEPPVVKTSENRSEMIYNSAWKFTPKFAKDKKSSSGYIYVPGAWTIRHSWKRPLLGGIIEYPKDKSWNKNSLKNCYAATYERTIFIPESWKGKSIVLEIDRVCTDAVVFINNRKAGQIYWPAGTVNLTKFVKPGKNYQLKIDVVAQSDREFVENFNNYDGKKVKAKIYNRGITGNVILKAEPVGMKIDNVFIKTSVRKKQITFQLQMERIAPGRNINFKFQITSLDGKTVKTFQAKAVSKASNQYEFSFDWKNPKLWSYRQPNLYYANITADSGRQTDELKERFGFREIRVAGRNILLNEKPFRMRVGMTDVTRTGGMKSILSRVLKNMIDSNFNIFEIIPDNFYERGTADFRNNWADAADELGIPAMMPALNFDSFIPWGSVGKPEDIEKWNRVMVKDWKKLRNHPSIFFMISGFNRFSNAEDQNPMKLGNQKKLYEYSSNYNKKLGKLGDTIMERMHKFDPSRIHISHQSGTVGDILTVNMYLGLTPLQEREEWLSEWVKSGDRPFTAIEFGCPSVLNMNRGREGGMPSSAYSEPLMTEFCAIYQGEDAFKTESHDYRKAIKQHWRDTRKYKSWHANPSITKSPAYRKLMDLFLNNTWKSWRSWGMTGGLLPWEMKSFCWNVRSDAGTRPTEPYIPFRKEPYAPAISLKFYNSFAPERRLPGGDLLVKLNAPELAWIAGRKTNFTEKDHNYYGSGQLEKQVVLINDNNQSQPFQYTAKISVDGKVIDEKSGSGTIGTASNLFFPIDAKLPKTVKQTPGKIVLNAEIGGKKLTDTFDFTVYPKLAISRNIMLSIYDTDGKTRNVLKNMGYRVRSWNGTAEISSHVLIIGADMLKNMPQSSMNIIERFTANGGVAIFMENAPEILREKFNFRYSRHVSRRAFPVKSAFKGYSSDMLKDWRGCSTTVPARAGVEMQKKLDKFPKYGFHWNNTGAVASSMIEKPHCTSWTPLFQGEFSLNYTPLMEMKYEKGLVILNSYDLVNRTSPDPAARKLLADIISYAESNKPDKNKRQCFYLGNDADYNFLRKLQLNVDRVKNIPESTDSLLIVGRDYNIDQKALSNFIQQGGNAVILPRSKGKFGPFTIAPGVYSINKTLPDWKILRGLSITDFYLKTDFKCDLISTAGDDSRMALHGAIGFVKSGKGLAVLIQITPDMLNSEKYDYYRYASWGWTRALSQIITNLGGSFAADKKFFTLRKADKRFQAIPLPLEWKAEFERKVSTCNGKSSRLKDVDNVGVKKQWHTCNFDDSRWRKLQAGKYWEAQGDYWIDANGVVWYRCKVHVPESWKGKALVLSLGAIDDMDTAYFNGVEVGATNKANNKTYWAAKRKYKIKPEIIKYGQDNTIAVRVFDDWGNGGFYSNPEELKLSILRKNEVDSYDIYASGFSESGVDGDDPYRYVRW